MTSADYKDMIAAMEKELYEADSQDLLDALHTYISSVCEEQQLRVNTDVLHAAYDKANYSLGYMDGLRQLSSAMKESVRRYSLRIAERE